MTDLSNVDTQLLGTKDRNDFLKRQHNRFDVVVKAMHQWRHDLLKHMAEVVPSEPVFGGDSAKMHELEDEFAHLTKVWNLYFGRKPTSED